jgi:signal transduction histidine kinase
VNKDGVFALPGAERRLPVTAAWLPFAAAAVAASLATLAVPLISPLQFAYPAPSLRVALDTGGALIGLLAAAIVVRSCREHLRVDRLLIAAGLVVVALTGGVLTTMLAIAPGSGPRGLIALTGTFVGALLLLAGAFAPMRRPRSPHRAVAATVGATLVAVGATAGLVALALAGRSGAAGPQAEGPLLPEPLVIVVLMLVPAAWFALAAWGLTRRGIRTGDAFARRLGLAVLCFAFAKVHYTLLPPVTHEWVHCGDVLRVLFCVVLLWAAVLEVAAAVAARAAERERRRIARDLHDGVAQELAFIRRRAAARDQQDIVIAAERALLDSRWAIEQLSRAPEEPLERVLARHAAVIAARTDVAVTFATTGSAVVGPEVSEALARILGEAVANARHGNATRVHVFLSTDPLRMTVIDDGTGFDPAARAAAGFGLGGMRERAALVGAELSVRSGPGTGTEVAVELR